MDNTIENVVEEVTGNNSGVLKDVAKVSIGAAVGIGTFVLVRKAVGKISDARRAKRVEAAEPVDIDEDEFDVEVAEEDEK